METDNRFLDLFINNNKLKNNRIILYIQILSILAAISLSSFFLTANNPFNLYLNNKELKVKLENLKNENNSLKSLINEQKYTIDSMKVK
jgi:hypothetical protein